MEKKNQPNCTFCESTEDLRPIHENYVCETCRQYVVKVYKKEIQEDS